MHPWFSRTFDAGSRPRKVTPPPDRDTLIRMRERAAVLAECAKVARTYEQKGADAGIVRVILESRALGARQDLALLDEAPADRLARGGGVEGVGASSSGSAHPPTSQSEPHPARSHPLDGEPVGDQHPAGFPSSGSTDVQGTPDTDPLKSEGPFTPEEEAELRGIVRGFDMAYKALGIPEPQSIGVGDPEKPRLRRVK